MSNGGRNGTRLFGIPCGLGLGSASLVQHRYITLRVAVVHPKKRAAAILAQVDWEMAQIKECDHHWEDGMEVSRLHTATPVSTHCHVECISVLLELNNISATKLRLIRA
jgi:hypothetical protein